MKNHSDVILSFSQFTANIQLFFFYITANHLSKFCVSIFLNMFYPTLQMSVDYVDWSVKFIFNFGYFVFCLFFGKLKYKRREVHCKK